MAATNHYPKSQLRHPWKKWLRKKRLHLVRGRDFYCQPHSMMIQIRGKATRIGCSVSVSIREDELFIAWGDRS
jgi:hypothetical protein